MDILKRVKRILKATIHDLTERTEDPELELAKFVEACELALGELHAEIEDAQLRSDRLAQELSGYRQTADEWMARAERSAAEDRKEAALEALRRRRETLQEVSAAEENLAAAGALLATLHDDASALEKKLKQALQEQKRLSVQLRGAEADSRVGAVLGRPDRSESIREKVQERVFQGQAIGEVGRKMFRDTPEARFQALDDQISLEEELAALMEKVKRTK